MITQFIRRLWRFITVAKNATGNLIFILIVSFIVASILLVDSVSVPDSAALVINPTGIIVEQKRAIDPVAQFLSGYQNENIETLLKDILDAIATAESDQRIKILILDLDKFQGTAFSKLEEIGDALEHFKESGKSVYAFARGYNQSQYYLAAHANEIYLDENSNQFLGGVFLTGLGVYSLYFKSALDKYKVNYHIYKAGLYKSAVEPYERDDMSPEAKRASLSWLNRLWDEYAATVTREREISREGFDRYTNQYDELLGDAGNDANRLAVQYNLVDDLISEQEWEALMADIVGSNGDRYYSIHLQDYLDATRPPIAALNPASNKIAVITASGVIYDGEQPAGSIGSASISSLIRSARDNQSVKALVLRLDTPGGSPSASEQIRTELALAQNAGKPVVVSMSSYAASGGYWIAATANKIYAASTTITGSIGVFAALPTLEETAADLGIYSDGVGTTNLSGSLDLFKNMNPAIDNIIRKSVEHTYDKFIGLVARGRNMTRERVETLAQGRVWAATDALNHGLIDAVGNLNDAIDSAALLADVGTYEVLYLEKTLSPKERLFREMLNSGLKIIFRITGGHDYQGLSAIHAVSKELREIVSISRNPGIYLECLECRLSTNPILLHK